MMDSPKSSNGNASVSDVVENPPVDSVLSLNCRSIRFGTLRTSPNGAGFHFTHTGISVFVRWTNDSNCNQSTRSYDKRSGSSQNHANERTFNISVGWRHIKELQYYIGPALSVIFVSVNSFVGHRLRTLFNMVEHADGTYPAAYFDSDSQNMYHRFITIVANATRPQDHQRLEHTLERLDFKSAIITALDFKTANRQLSLTMPPMALEQMCSASEKSTHNGSFQSSAADQEFHQPLKVRKILADAVVVVSPSNMVAKGSDKCFVKRVPMSQLSTKVEVETKAANKYAAIEENTAPEDRSSLMRPAAKRPSKPPSSVVLYIQPGSHITVHLSDLQCLEDGEFINDIVIDFYLQYILTTLSPERSERVHIFPSFFWLRLHQKLANEDVDGRNPAQLHARVKNWTKHVDIFEKDFLLIPINESMHWYLVIVCYPGLNPLTTEADDDRSSRSNSPELFPCASGKKSPDDAADEEYSKMASTYGEYFVAAPTANHSKEVQPVKEPLIIILDSLMCDTPRLRYKTAQTVRDYLSAEWSFRKRELRPRQFFGVRGKGEFMKGIYPKPPQQHNGSDCGVFLLEYAERFLHEDLPKDSSHSRSTTASVDSFLISSRSKLDLTNWFSSKHVETKRQEIRDLILRLSTEQKKEQS